MPPVLGDASADAYLGELVARLRSILGEHLVGAWLVNSGARADYLPGRSDLDVTVAVRQELARPLRRPLADALVHRSLPCVAPRLELVVYRRAVLAAPGVAPAYELNLNTGPSIADHVATDPAADPPHWFVLDLSAARERALALAGPPLSELLAPIPDAVVIGALLASSAWYGTHDAAAPSRVLNACRAWLWLSERRWSSKSEAAAWAVEHGGDRDLIELALSRRRGETEAPLALDRVAAFAARVDERVLLVRHVRDRRPSDLSRAATCW